MKSNISIITPILQVDKKLINLASSIYHQLNKNFNWIVIGEDNLKKNFVTKIKKSYKNIFFIEFKKKGIYSALNEGLKSTKIHEYYLVLGQDDYVINKRFFEELSNEINLDKKHDLSADIYDLNTVAEKKNKISKFQKIKQNFSPIFNHHSGGMLIKTILHKKYGFYDEKFQLASDYKFLKKIKKKILIKKTQILSTKIGVYGSSSRKPLYGLFERLLIDIDKKENYVKILILLKYFFKLFKQIILNNKTR